MKSLMLAMASVTILAATGCSGGSETAYAPLTISDSTVRTVFSNYNGLDRQGLQCDASDSDGYYCTILQPGESTINFQRDASDPEAYKTLSVTFKDDALAYRLGLPEGNCSGVDELPEFLKASMGVMGLYAKGFSVDYLYEFVNGEPELDSMTDEKAAEINSKISPALERIGQDVGLKPTTLKVLCGID